MLLWEMFNIECSMLNTQPIIGALNIEHWAFDIGY